MPLYVTIQEPLHHVLKSPSSRGPQDEMEMIRHQTESEHTHLDHSQARSRERMNSR